MNGNQKPEPSELREDSVVARLLGGVETDDFVLAPIEPAAPESELPAISPEALLKEQENVQEYAEIVAEGSFEEMREQNRRRERGRRAVYVLLAVTLCLAIAVGCVFFYFRISEVRVTGSELYDADELLRSSGIVYGENIYSIDKNQIRALLLREYPYIESIEIYRQLPGAVVIEVTESAPYYYFELCGEYYVLANDFRILERVDVLDDVRAGSSGLIRIETASIAEAIVGQKLIFRDSTYGDAIIGMLEVFRGCVLSEHIDSVNLRNRYDVYFVYDNRIRVEIGEMTDLRTKITCASAILDKVGPHTRGIVNVENDQAYLIARSDIDLT